MLRVIYAEDDMGTSAQIREYLLRYSKEREPLQITSYADGEELLEHYTACDILLLDVEMPKLNGMDAARRIREKDKNVVIVFLTNLADFAIQGYEVNAMDFILKPIQYYGFALRLDRAVERLHNRAGGHVILSLPEGKKILNTADIYYLETLNKLLVYHTKQGDFSVSGTLRKAESELVPYHFARCNQCYLVNLDHVSETYGNLVKVAGQELVISKRNKAAFLEALVQHIGRVS